MLKIDIREGSWGWLGMLERRLIFQEGNASPWLLLYLAATAAVVVFLIFRGMARYQTKSKPKTAGQPGILWDLLAGSLLLGLGWQLVGMQLSVWLWATLGMTITAGVLIVMLLQYERKLVPKPVGNALLMLRVLVLLLFFFTLLKPAFLWALDKTYAGRVLVAVDLSESMTITDAHASDAEKLRWARALNLIGNESNQTRLDGWQQSLDNGQEPNWVDDAETSDPKRRQVLAASRKEQLSEIFEQLDQVSRKELAKRLLTETANPLLTELEKVGTVEIKVFGGKSETADAQSLGQYLDNPPQSILPESSDLGLGLSSSTDSKVPLMGVVLLTDGRDNVGKDLARRARRMGDRDVPVPVFPVLIGTEQRPKDLSIAHLDIPQNALTKDKPVLKAKLNTSGFEGQEVTIELKSEQGDPITQTITPTGPETDITFKLEEEKIGQHEYTLTLKPQKGETRKDNNSRRFALTIVGEKVQVLLAEGEARWEFRYLTNAFYRDVGIGRANVKEVVFHQPFIGIMQNTWFPSTLKLPQQDDDLANSPFAGPDLIVIGDVAAADMPEKAWKLLERFVTESGGTLVLMAGKNDFPLAHQSPTLERLLPLTKLRTLNLDNAQSTGDPLDADFICD